MGRGAPVKHSLIEGDCLEVLRGMEADSVDAVVTDPPYGLSFMGKGWDYEVPTEDVWRECLRVLKPGGHLLAFAGTRTQHRMAVRIEDAGFEIRDMIAWVYGSGFPKSLDVSKAIDKMDAAEEQQARRFRFTEWVRSTGIIAAQIDVLTGTRMGHHYTTHPTQPSIMTREHLEACRMFLGDIPEWVERECDIRSVESRNMAAREVVGVETLPDTSVVRAGFVGMTAPNGVIPKRPVNITAPATDAARQWDGWGTALKPALEPITIARKPLVGTVAQNVMQHGTGALNIDGCRVGTLAPTTTRGANALGRMNDDGWTPSDDGQRVDPHPAGRWPANLIHDGSEEVMTLFPMTESGSRRAGKHRVAGGQGRYGEFAVGELPEIVGDSGSAARFFYCAKASRSDREDGLESDSGTLQQSVAFGQRKHGTLPYTKEIREQNPRPRVNTHPTVKPTDLMRYLCRLVTPPNGVVLDPFMGSGSTGKAAMLDGFRFVGIEREADYIEIARARIEAAQRSRRSATPTLFDCLDEDGCDP
jgi:DNA modification methylase